MVCIVGYLEKVGTVLLLVVLLCKWVWEWWCNLGGWYWMVCRRNRVGRDVLFFVYVESVVELCRLAFRGLK